MSEYFRRVIIKFFLKKELTNANLATSLINWRHSGFSWTPLYLKKIGFEENGEGTLIFLTSSNDFYEIHLEIDAKPSPERIAIYPAIWAICFPHQGQAAVA
jgi:hypothetical protein